MNEKENGVLTERRKRSQEIGEIFQNSNQSRREMLKIWVLLDDQSTAHVFCSSNFLKFAGTVKGGLQINTNGGTLKCNQQGTCQNTGDAWHHPDAVTNILSFSLVKVLHHVTCDNEHKDALIAHKPSGETVRLTNCGQGSHCVDPTMIGMTLMNTVRKMRGHFLPQ